MRDVCGLVGLPAQRDGRQKRRVRLDQDPIRRRARAPPGSSSTSDTSRCPQRKIKPRSQRAGRLVLIPGEAMHDARQPGRRPVLGNQRTANPPTHPPARTLPSPQAFASSDVRQWIVIGFRAAAAIFICATNAACCVANVRVVEVIVVKPNLPDRQASRVGHQLLQLGKILGRSPVRLLRMNPGRRPNLRMRPRNPAHGASCPAHPQSRSRAASPRRPRVRAQGSRQDPRSRPDGSASRSA